MVEDEQRGVVPSTKADPAAKPGGFKFFAATLLLVGIVSVGAQFAAASTGGIAEHVTLGSPTGPGLIAIISGLVMGAKCRSWESWRKWIWLPLVIAVTLVFVVMGFTAQSIAAEEAEEEAHQAEVAQACQAMRQQIETKATEIDDRRAAAESIDRPSWATGQPGSPLWADDEAADSEYDRLLSEYSASCQRVD